MRFEEACEGWTEAPDPERCGPVAGHVPPHLSPHPQPLGRLGDHRRRGWHVQHYTAWYKREGGPPFGQALAQLGIEMIPAYSPEARGRSERAFRSHQARLVRALEVAGMTDRAAADRYLPETY